MSNENELIQYILVNKDLEMSKGKTGAQIGHACTICAVDLTKSNDSKFNEWFNNEQKKVVLGAHEKDIRKLIDLGFKYYVIDSGYTEIPAGSLTVLSLGIMTRKEAEQYTKRFQTLK
jgi:peptidyl-tRNA hydrolase